MSDDLGGDLMDYIYATYSQGPRERSHWVMSAEWFYEICKLADPSGRAFFSPRVATTTTLLGIPVEVRAGCSPPRDQEVSCPPA